jgi:hypothetical protein
MLHLNLLRATFALLAMLAIGCGGSDGDNGGGLAEEGEWTEFVQGDDDRIVHVSESLGDDAWDGLAPEHTSGSTGPKRTLWSGVGQLRNGSADWLLLRRGDRFEETVDIHVAGRSETEPILISSYGEAPERPVVVGGVHFGPRADGEVDHLAITDIRFEGGMVSASQGNHITIEGCHFEGGLGAVYTSGAEPRSNWRVRRNTANRTDGTSFFFSHMDGLLVEGNVVYHADPNGPNPAIHVAREGSSGAVVRRNLIYVGKEAGSGVLLSSGGVAEENVLVDVGWSAIAMGACNDDGGPEAGPCLDPVPVTIHGNAMLYGSGIGGGINVEPDYVQPGMEITDNLLLHGSPDGISMSVGGDEAVVSGNTLYNALAGLALGRHMTWSDNVLWTDRERPLLLAHELPDMEGFTAIDNRYYHAIRAHAWFAVPQEVDFEQWRSMTDETGSDGSFDFVDPTRDVATYHQSLGGSGETDAFFEEALRRSKSNDRPEYTARALLEYLREGYSVQ